MATINVDKVALLKIANILRKSRSPLPVQRVKEDLSVLSSVDADVFLGEEVTKWFNQLSNLSLLGLSEVSAEDVEAVGSQLIGRGYVYPVEMDGTGHRVKAMPKSDTAVFDSDTYYAWDYKPAEFFTLPNLMIILVGIVFVAGFQYWPRWVIKYFINATMVVFFLSILIYLVRFVVLAVAYCFGYVVWIFPNLDKEDGFFDSFRPLVTIQKTRTPVFVRYALLGLFLSMCTFLIAQPKSYIKFGKDQKEFVVKVVSGKYLEELLDQRDRYMEEKRKESEPFVPGSNIHYEDENGVDHTPYVEQPTPPNEQYPYDDDEFYED